MNLQELLCTLDSHIVIRPTRRMTLGELETYLDKAADILRGNADHSEFRGYVFALRFYKRINDCFDEEVRAQTTKLRRAGIADEQADHLARRPEIHHFVVPEPAAWGRVARTAKGQLGQALNDAMLAIERANAHRQNNFDGILTGKIDFNKQDELPRDKLVYLINHFGSQTFDRAHVSDDLFGNAYEYLIRNFASKAGKSSGEFYTPAEVGFLMAEVLQPHAAMSICDWASGSGGLLLQCIRYVRKHGGDTRQLRLHGQESNVATYNISRINMILHGIPVWDHKQGDSHRDPRHLTADNRLRQFDRVIINPPFSLEDWGYDTVAAGDKFGRLSCGMPPASNGDWAWLQQIAKSLKDADPVTGVGGQGMVVMSQGVLFRGQPEQTEEEDGQNQKADAEYVIRRGFIEADLIEAIVVLPGKLFYGNGVPGCLVLLNKAKPAARKDQVLMIWASRHFQKGNPQKPAAPLRPDAHPGPLAGLRRSGHSAAPGAGTRGGVDSRSGGAAQRPPDRHRRCLRPGTGTAAAPAGRADHARSPGSQAAGRQGCHHTRASLLPPAGPLAGCGRTYRNRNRHRRPGREGRAEDPTGHAQGETRRRAQEAHRRHQDPPQAGGARGQGVDRGRGTRKSAIAPAAP